MKLNPPLLALAVGAFGIGVTEFAPMGMLPVIAGDLGVSIPAAGLLVSDYAFGVLIGAPLMTLTTGRLPRRTLLISLMGIFTLGNLLSAVAPEYWSLMAARVVTSFNHGAFFGVGSIVAASVVAPNKRAGAVAAMFTVFTYIAPILKEQTLASSAFVTAMLVVYGVGLTVGNWLGGRFADKSVDRTLIITLASLAALLVLFAVVMPWQAPAAVVIFLWGVASFALVPPLQMRVMTAASDAPNLASAMNIGAFNLGNAIGAALGGAVIGLNLGYPAVALAGAVMAASGLILVLLLVRREARAIPTTAPARG